MILITGGADFIGANFVLDWLAGAVYPVVDLDKLTYARQPGEPGQPAGDARHLFVQGDLGDRALVSCLLTEHHPRAVVNFATESHVDHSIHRPEDLIQTNIVGNFRLLEAVLAYWSALPKAEKSAFRLLRVSTDEGYGTLSKDAPPFAETNANEPNSPYSASKGASDHLVRAWHHTYGLPVLTTNCSQQQLRTLPLPREAHPAHDRQRPGRQALAGVRRRHAGALTGSTSKTTAAPSAACWRPINWAKPTTSGAGTK